MEIIFESIDKADNINRLVAMDKKIEELEKIRSCEWSVSSIDLLIMTQGDKIRAPKSVAYEIKEALEAKGFIYRIAIRRLRKKRALLLKKAKKEAEMIISNK